MSDDYLRERAEEIASDRALKDTGAAQRAREFLRALEAFEAVAEDVETSRQIKERERDEENVRTMKEAGWDCYPRLNELVTPRSESHRFYGKIGLIRGYASRPGCVAIEWPKTLVCGVPLATVRSATPEEQAAHAQA